jgi:hypothetical protein
MEELEFVQRKLLKALIKKTEEKKENNQNISLFGQLSKTIAGISKVLSEFGLGLSVLSKIKSLITIKYNAENNNDDED